MHPTLLLVSSPRSDWDALRAAAQTSPAVRLLACVQQVRVALSLAARHRPDVVVADADVPDRPIIPFVGDLRAASPGSKVVLIGDRTALDQGTLAALWHRGIAGYFVWEDIHPETVPNALITVLDADVLAGSRAVLEVLLASDRRQRPRVDGLVLAASEREALGRDSALERLCKRRGIGPEVAAAAIALLRAAQAEGGGHSADLSALIGHDSERPRAPAGVAAALSERERAVCKLAAEGKHYPAIAALLSITTSTVKSHAAHAKAKLGLGEGEELGPAYRRLARG